MIGLQLLEILPHSPQRLRVLDPLLIHLVEIALVDPADLLDRLVQNALVRRELANRLLSRLRLPFGNRFVDDSAGNSILSSRDRYVDRDAQCHDPTPSVPCGPTSDALEELAIDVATQPGLDALLDDLCRLSVGVLVELDAMGGVNSGANPLVEAGEELDLAVGDEDQREVPDRVEVVERIGVFELVNLVEDENRRLVERRLEDVDEFVSRRRVAVYRAVSELLDGTKENRVARVGSPAVDVARLNVERLLCEFTERELRDGGLPHAGGAEEMDVVGGEVLDYRLKCVCHAVDLSVSMEQHLTSRDVFVVECPSVCNHPLDRFPATQISGREWLPEASGRQTSGSVGTYST